MRICYITDHVVNVTKNSLCVYTTASWVYRSRIRIQSVLQADSKQIRRRNTAMLLYVDVVKMSCAEIRSGHDSHLKLQQSPESPESQRLNISAEQILEIYYYKHSVKLALYCS